MALVLRGGNRGLEDADRPVTGPKSGNGADLSRLDGADLVVAAMSATDFASADGIAGDCRSPRGAPVRTHKVDSNHPAWLIVAWN